jgi:hypothetical protein
LLGRQRGGIFTTEALRHRGFREGRITFSGGGSFAAVLRFVLRQRLGHDGFELGGDGGHVGEVVVKLHGVA